MVIKDVLCDGWTFIDLIDHCTDDFTGFFIRLRTNFMGLSEYCSRNMLSQNGVMFEVYSYAVWMKRIKVIPTNGSMFVW